MENREWGEGNGKELVGGFYKWYCIIFSIQRNMKKIVGLLFFVFVFFFMIPMGADAQTCTGLGTNKPGTCVLPSASCSGTLEGVGKTPACTGGTYCCVPSGGGTCAGTCKGSCDLAVENVSKTGCSDPLTPDCCTAKTPTTPSTPTTPTSISFPNPLGSMTTVQAVLGAILGGLQGIIVTLALVFIVVGAVLYVTSAGSEKQIETAKGAIFAAMIGLALGIAAPSFLKEIATILGWGAVPANVSASASLTSILLKTLSFLLGILGVLAVIMLVIGGLMYMTSAGSEDRIERGKKILIWASVGVIVAMASLVIVSQIADFF